ncbi:hypothetical protein [Brevibacillus sp. MER 51]|uniref:phage baseplate plug family protein n=1 Tax=Brevibacillus sp. MER 51 TaxID=2939560 RepID=UPI00203FA83B|nr:hypothetical protein [Brevibacillus sp. MER 51]MCM3141655.1 hypothetical protein [Brevibacillus sp. MER 51]
MATTILPITPATNQTFTCTLPVGNKNITLQFTLIYNAPGGYWSMSVKEHDAGVMLIDALPLLLGEYPAANVLKQHSYLGIGSAVVISLTEDRAITFESLGKDHLIVWTDNID